MTLRSLRRGSRLAGAAIVALVVLCGAGTVSAQSATGAAAAGGDAPVRVEVLAEPHAVTGSDGNRHLVYELKLTNTTDKTTYKTTYYVTEVTALDSRTGQPVALVGSVQLLVDPPPAPMRTSPSGRARLPVRPRRGPGSGSVAERAPPPGRHLPDQH